MYVSEFNQKIDNFVNTWNGQMNGYFPAYTGQCVQIINQYNNDVIGAPFIRTPASMGARDWFEVFADPAGDYYERIANNPSDPNQTPQRGDVMVWGRSWGGGYGHIAIVLGADANGFDSFEQNNPVGSDCHQVHHNWNGILGWLRPHVDADPPPPPPTPPPLPDVTPAAVVSLFEDITSVNLVTTKDSTIWDLSSSTWPEFQSNPRTSIANGYAFTAVQKYNHPLGGVYYVTTANDLHGINITDAADAPIAAPVVVPSDTSGAVEVKVLTDWRNSYKPLKADYTAKEDYQVQDIAGLQIALALHKGDTVHGAGEFQKDSVNYIRHQKAVDNEWWYGIPLSQLDMVLPKSDTLLPGFKPYDNTDSDILDQLNITEELKAIQKNAKLTLRQNFIKIVASITGFFLSKNKKGIK